MRFQEKYQTKYTYSSVDPDPESRSVDFGLMMIELFHFELRTDFFFVFSASASAVGRVYSS